MTDDDSSDSDLVLPKKEFIKQDARIQTQIQKRLDRLKAINEQDDNGKFKSQTPNDNIYVKCKKKTKIKKKQQKNKNNNKK